MRRFFLALGVRVEVVARPLPHVLQPAQRPPQRVLGRPPFRGELQDLLEQGYGPARVRVAEFLGRPGEEGRQQVLLVFVEQRVAPPPGLVVQRQGVVGLGVALDPVVDALAGHAEHAGQLGGRAAPVELQHGQGAPQDAGVQGFGQLTPEAAALPRCQVQSAHALLLAR